jgi:AraC family transcriptional regulator, transcriptional activator FtrA
MSAVSMSPSAGERESHKVAILVDNNLALFELGCAVELFALPRPEIANWYQTEVVTFASSNLQATGGLTLAAKQVTDLANYQTLVIPSWPVKTKAIESMLGAIIGFYQNGGRILSFCSGGFLLAQTGLLDGKSAITHWRYADEFKQSFPQVKYIEDVLYLYDGQLGCSAGSSAAIDLGIEVIRQDFGYQIANQVARRLVLAAHRSGGQSQFVETPLPKDSSQFSATLDWAIENINQSLDVGQLADKANMTRRTFDRHFRSTLNMSPKEWLIQQRLERAKSLLETTQHKVDQVAYQSGFESAMSLRHNFRKYLRLSPTDYRKQFFRQAS